MQWHTLKSDDGGDGDGGGKGAGLGGGASGKGGGKEVAVGRVKLAVKFEALDKHHIAKTPEVTVEADTYCHFYLLDFESQELIKVRERETRQTDTRAHTHTQTNTQTINTQTHRHTQTDNTECLARRVCASRALESSPSARGARVRRGRE
jgi:hypothetical protein